MGGVGRERGKCDQNTLYKVLKELKNDYYLLLLK